MKDPDDLLHFWISLLSPTSPLLIVMSTYTATGFGGISELGKQLKVTGSLSRLLTHSGANISKAPPQRLPICLVNMISHHPACTLFYEHTGASPMHLGACMTLEELN